MNKHILFGCILMICSCNCDQKNNEIDQVTTLESTELNSSKPTLGTNRPKPSLGGGKAKSSASPTDIMAEEARMDGVSEEDISRKRAAMEGETANSNTIRQSMKKGGLPASCQFLDQKWMERYFKVGKTVFQVKDASNPVDDRVKSCFFRWDNGVLPNSGIFLQLQSNPFPEEIPNYGTTFIKGKLESGEQGFGDGAVNYQFKKFDVAGNEGAYSPDQAKFFWMYGDNLVFMLAFNLGKDAKTEHKYAVDLSKEIMKNYERYLSNN